MQWMLSLGVGNCIGLVMQQTAKPCDPLSEIVGLLSVHTVHDRFVAYLLDVRFLSLQPVVWLIYTYIQHVTLNNDNVTDESAYRKTVACLSCKQLEHRCTCLICNCWGRYTAPVVYAINSSVSLCSSNMRCSASLLIKTE
jgi:hypothetical protein